MATKKERRIAIAKDAIAQIKAGKYESSPGVLCYFPEEMYELSDRDPKLSGQKVLKTKLKATGPCYVCARGALFVSLVRKENKVDLRDLVYAKNIDEKLTNLFGRNQWTLMEAYFEGYRLSYQLQNTNALKFGLRKYPDLDTEKFYRKYQNAEDRLIAILKNLIKNGGTFNPHKW